MNALMIHPDYWMNSQLSIARYYGGCVIQGRYYFINKESDYLIRDDLRMYVNDLGFKTVEKAVKRHADEKEVKAVLRRLRSIVKARKRAEKRQETKLFEL